HIHFSFRDAEGRAVSYDETREGGVSRVMGCFAAGILCHISALCAFTTPSVVSYQRLLPHNWSAGFACLSDRNREAALRICPTVSKPGCDIGEQFNIEFRVADATASPHLQLATLMMAGLSGITEKKCQPQIVG